MDFSLVLCIGFLALVHDGGGTRPAQCRIDRVFKMLGADCSAHNYVVVPVISRSVEILDASVNRIRSLKNDSFSTYGSLKMLYLFDNLIHIIEPGAFEPLVHLEVLDLHMNAIRDLPPYLPFPLRKLYLADNDVNSIIPLHSAQSLEFLSFAGNRLTSIPQTGILPQLTELNMTDNPLDTLTVDQLANFCQLVTLRLPPSLMTTHYPSTCDCVRVNTWILKHSIYVYPLFNCTVIDESECLSNGSLNAQTAYAHCKATHQALAWSGSSAWVLGVSGAALVFIMALVLFYLWRKKYPRTRPPQGGGPSAEEVRKMKALKRSRSFASRASFRSPSKSSVNTARTYANRKDNTSSTSKFTKSATPSTKPPYNSANGNQSRNKGYVTDIH